MDRNDVLLNVLTITNIIILALSIGIFVSIIDIDTNISAKDKNVWEHLIDYMDDHRTFNYEKLVKCEPKHLYAFVDSVGQVRHGICLDNGNRIVEITTMDFTKWVEEYFNGKDERR